MRLFLLRHGATALSESDHFCGRTDAPLSPRGEAQARAAAQRLAAEPFAACYASPLQRTLRTAEIVTAGRVSITTGPALREIDHGHWETLHQDEVKRRFAAEYAAWAADPLTFAPAGGETGLSVLARALPALRRVVEAHSERPDAEHPPPSTNVLVVSHKATIRLCAAALLGLDPRRYRDRLALDAGSLSILAFETFDRPRLELWNWTG